jgi:hypothetical protein
MRFLQRCNMQVLKKHAFPDNYMKKLLQCAPMCIFSGTHMRLVDYF